MTSVPSGAKARSVAEMSKSVVDDAIHSRAENEPREIGVGLERRGGEGNDFGQRLMLGSKFLGDLRRADSAIGGIEMELRPARARPTHK